MYLDIFRYIYINVLIYICINLRTIECNSELGYSRHAGDAMAIACGRVSCEVLSPQKRWREVNGPVRLARIFRSQLFEYPTFYLLTPMGSFPLLYLLTLGNHCGYFWLTSSFFSTLVLARPEPYEPRSATALPVHLLPAIH